MNKLKTYIPVVILASSLFSCPVLAHEGHDHGEEETDTHIELKVLRGKWTFKEGSDLTLGKRPQIRFHAGHEHPVGDDKASLILSFCTDKESNLYGIVENKNVIDDLAERFNVSASAEGEDDSNFLITLTPTDESEDVVLSFTLDAADTKKASVSFGEDATTYTITRKKPGVTPACRKLIRNQVRNN